ncbi:MAG: hypothetical protein JKY17_09575 [Magnetovibrio sp.]|nr:hypothetical protein [Magnetovibrio sp.]
MTLDFKTFKTAVGQILFVGVIASLTAGCASKVQNPPPKRADYRQNHKIQVTREHISVSIALPDHGFELSPSDQRRFRVFLRDFVQRGRSSVVVESALPTLAQAILVKNGFRENEIIFAPSTTIPAPNAVLSFTANKVVAPECGDWTSSNTFNPLNQPHPNFGCSLQRNIGKVVADPGDFIQQQPAFGGAATRSDQAIQRLQAPPAPLP